MYEWIKATVLIPISFLGLFNTSQVHFYLPCLPSALSIAANLLCQSFYACFSFWMKPLGRENGVL